MTGGGGGFGPPGERDASLVRADVRDRHLTTETARQVYGVDCGGATDTPIERA
jgi:N-methylhydantoinase B